jgi:serine/threonine protein kinase
MSLKVRDRRQKGVLVRNRGATHGVTLTYEKDTSISPFTVSEETTLVKHDFQFEKTLLDACSVCLVQHRERVFYGGSYIFLARRGARAKKKSREMSLSSRIAVSDSGEVVYVTNWHLGKGAQGDVFLAVWKDRFVACKIGPHLQSESKIIQCVSMRVYGESMPLVKMQNEPCVLMPLASYDLYDVMAEETDCLMSKIDIWRQLTARVQDLHDEGFVHGDIKPENIGIFESRDVRLLDWGHCRERKLAHLEHTGTTAYMHPDKIGMRPIDPLLGDWWSVGVVGFILAFGNLPFRKACGLDQTYAKVIIQMANSTDTFTKCVLDRYRRSPELTPEEKLITDDVDALFALLLESTIARKRLGVAEKNDTDAQSRKRRRCEEEQYEVSHVETGLQSMLLRQTGAGDALNN